jgi:hypothetical protein
LASVEEERAGKGEESGVILLATIRTWYSKA